jgi:TolA-binding protein
MVETPQQIYFLAAVVVGLGLIILGFFLREAFTTSNFYRQGVTLYQQKDYKGAESAFRKVISRHPSNDMVHLLLGDVLMQQNKLEEAIAQFKELIDRAPKNVDARLRLGDVLMQQNKLEEAVGTLEKARDLFKAQRNTQKADQIDRLLQQCRVGSAHQLP